MLNKEQEKVVYTKEPFLFLLAGAGTGKTRVIVERVKYLISTGVKPEKILAITFTNRAANEMRERVNNEDVAVHTFHQLCYQKMKSHLTYDYQIVDENIPFSREDKLLITRYKNSYFKEKKPKNYDKYQTYLKENRRKDFDDLLLDFHHHFHLLSAFVDYTYIFIDEFQDTNLLQYMIVKKMIHKYTHVLCVGDPDQSIYRFRGAHDQIIELFIKEYRAKVYHLTYNYRSTKPIIDIANSLIKRNNNIYKKTLYSTNDEVFEQKILRFNNQQQESDNIMLIINNHIKKGIKASEIAVLFRNHRRSYDLRKKLDEFDIYYNTNNSIHLLTLHQAKGLEFSVVFIVGLEQGNLPSFQVHQLFDLQEERRLFFVGITRAKKYLYISYVHTNNEAEYFKKSQFLSELKVK